MSVIEKKLFDVDTEDKKLRIFIKSRLKVYEAVAVGKAVIEKEELCATSFRFTVKKDSGISFNQGDAVSAKIGDKVLFFGYVFSKERDKEKLIEVTAYDQMRYMKNKICYTRGSETLEEIVHALSDKYGFLVGEVDKCSVELLPMAGECVSLLDVVKSAIRSVRQITGDKYILFDDSGYLCLKNEKNLMTDVLLDQSVSENYIYKDSIDNSVYNKIVLYGKTRRFGESSLYEAEDKESIDKWGTLILTKKASSYLQNEKEAENLLESYCRINREIVIKGALGNEHIIPGSSLFVQLTMGDIALDGYMRVKKAVHIFENNLYTTDVYLDGSEIE